MSIPGALLLSPPGVEGNIIDVALNFNGRKKRVRHLDCTRVGQLAELHLSNQASQKAIVVVDSQGFEIGKELTLGVLMRQLGLAHGGLLELTLQIDDW